jgi:hypothetical protein
MQIACPLFIRERFGGRGKRAGLSQTVRASYRGIDCIPSIPNAAGPICARINFPMKSKKTPLIITLTLAALCSGCVDTGPNTQQGVVGGAAVGALAGAIIGNNSGHHNAASGAAIGALAGAIAGGTLGNAKDHREGTIYTSQVAATSSVVMADPPPMPLRPSEVIPAQPLPEAVWVGGYWVYNPIGRYEWVSGRWEVPPQSRRVFVAPHWERRAGGYVYFHGYWRY